MHSRETKSPLIGDLKDRISYLEEVNRFVLDALDTAATLGDFQTQINSQKTPEFILKETRERINAIITCEATAFFLVDDETNEFLPATIDPEDKRSFFLKEMDILVESDKFSWALRERRPVFTPCFLNRPKILLHVLATSTRVHGMFMGLLPRNSKRLHEISLSFLSLILLYSANALESLQLYEKISKISESLLGMKNYRNLFDAAPDGVEVIDREGRLLDCNDTLQKMTGYSREQLIGNYTSLYCPDNNGENRTQRLSTI